MLDYLISEHNILYDSKASSINYDVTTSCVFKQALEGEKRQQIRLVKAPAG